MSRVETKAGRGGTLDVLRFAAALFVVLFHYGDEAPTPLASFHSVFDRGYLATDFFILLSGYVLGRAYGRAIETGRTGPAEFLGRRVARIWPAHAIVLLCLVLVVTAATLGGIQPSHGGQYALADLAPQLLLVQAWADVGGAGWNLPTWSLSALVFCYAAFPLVWRAVVRMPIWTAAAAAAAIVTLFNVLSWRLMGNGLFDLPFYLGAYRALPMFLAGVVVARWAAERPLSRPVAILIALGAGLGLVGLQLVGTFNAVSFALIALAVLGIGSIPVSRPMPLAEAAGKLSFALFISHVLVAAVWFGLVHLVDDVLPASVRWLLWGGAFVAAVGGAWLFDRIIDQPLQRWLAPRLSRVFSPRPARYPEPEPSG